MILGRWWEKNIGVHFPRGDRDPAFRCISWYRQVYYSDSIFRLCKTQRKTNLGGIRLVHSQRNHDYIWGSHRTTRKICATTWGSLQRLPTWGFCNWDARELRTGPRLSILWPQCQRKSRRIAEGMNHCLIDGSYGVLSSYILCIWPLLVRFWTNPPRASRNSSKEMDLGNKYDGRKEEW